MTVASPRLRRTAWLSRTIFQLLDQHPHLAMGEQAASAEPLFDVLIVGSGYGGAIAADALAGAKDGERTLRVAVLERGNEYLPGAFPSREAELPGHVRFSTAGAASPRGVLTGLFDLRLGPDANALVANGLGGGSLINAGVMLQPQAAIFDDAAWPEPLRGGAKAMAPYYDAARQLLGATSEDEAKVERAQGQLRYAKTDRLQQIAKGQAFGGVPITVAAVDHTATSGGVLLNACIGCGDCATGCNHQAKASLDTNLLVKAWRAGAEIYTGAEVQRVEKVGEHWCVHTLPTDGKLKLRQGSPWRITAKRVVLAAGTLGTCEILLRSERAGLALSPLLGQRFSANGDMIVSVAGMAEPVRGVADETQAERERQVGPTITAMADLRTAEGQGVIMQDLAVPGPLSRLYRESLALSRTMHALGKADLGEHHPGLVDPCAIADDLRDHALPMAMMARDAAEGRVVLSKPEEKGGDALASGTVHIEWPTLSEGPSWTAQHAQLRQMQARHAPGAQVLPNPMWQLLPEELGRMLGAGFGPMLTVHPLGGCAMGDNASDGVVDDWGRVFDGQGTHGALHNGLVVLDGSIVPMALGVNPALTISALCLRAVRGLCDAWGLSPPSATAVVPQARPMFREPPKPFVPLPTQVEVMERLRGQARLAGGQRRWLELTLFFRPTALQSLMDGAGHRAMALDPERSVLKVLKAGAEPDPLLDDLPEESIALRASLQGELAIFHHGHSGPVRRACRASWAWFINRGARDITQAGVERLGASAPKRGIGLFAYLRDLLRLTTHAGTLRTFDYRLTLHRPAGSECELLLGPAVDGQPLQLHGEKRLVYGLAANPLQQLMEMTLTRFPGLQDDDAVLSLDLPFLARQGVPLLRVTQQQDQPTALLDLASFAAYVGRILVSGHLWSFRKPDAPSPRRINRLPGHVSGMPAPVVTRLLVAEWERQPVYAQLTRYRPAKLAAGLPPVMMIHGYSASGTTFAHSSIECSLAQHLCHQGRDVWVLDMRSSPGMEATCRMPWAFEDMGMQDIPLAVAEVCRAADAHQIDVVAHCMGSAMLMMGLLGDAQPDEPDDSGRLLMRKRIRKLVMSQVGAAVRFTPANVGRAYLMRYAKQFLPTATYTFRSEATDAINTQGVDRLLAALPYGKEEFQLENPFSLLGKRLPWVGARHRMDALYGRVFALKNMGAETLECIDDFFGPLNLDTVTQVIQFVRYWCITDQDGINRFATPERVAERLRFPMLSLHAELNGLADVSTQAALDKLLRPTGQHRSIMLREVGHQDSLIGTAKATQATREAVSQFLNQP